MKASSRGDSPVSRPRPGLASCSALACTAPARLTRRSTLNAPPAPAGSIVRRASTTRRGPIFTRTVTTWPGTNWPTVPRSLSICPCIATLCARRWSWRSQVSTIPPGAGLSPVGQTVIREEDPPEQEHGGDEQREVEGVVVHLRDQRRVRQADRREAQPAQE